MSGGVNFNILSIATSVMPEYCSFLYTFVSKVICFSNEVVLLMKIGYFSKWFLTNCDKCWILWILNMGVPASCMQCSEFCKTFSGLSWLTHLPIWGCKYNCKVDLGFEENGQNLNGRLELLSSIYQIHLDWIELIRFYDLDTWTSIFKAEHFSLIFKVATIEWECQSGCVLGGGGDASVSLKTLLGNLLAF